MNTLIKKLLQTKQGIHLIGLVIGVVFAGAVLTLSAESEWTKSKNRAYITPMLCGLSNPIQPPKCLPEYVMYQSLARHHPASLYLEKAFIGFVLGWSGTVASLWMVLGLKGKWPK